MIHFADILPIVNGLCVSTESTDRDKVSRSCGIRVDAKQQRIRNDIFDVPSHGHDDVI